MSPVETRPSTKSLLWPLVYPSKTSSLPQKIRPVSPGVTSRPSSSRIFTTVPSGGVPAVSGWRRMSSGVAMHTQEASVEP